MARFIHAADLHLGRQLYCQPLLEDQSHALGQLRALVGRERPHALFLAGDIFDRTVPAKDAVALLDDFLCEVVLGLGVPVVMIAGNHDSPERLGFGSRLLRARGLHVVGPPVADPTPLVVHDEHGPVEVFALPFLEPAELRALLADEGIRDQQAAMTAMVARAMAVSRHPRRVLVAHAFVDGGLASESERPLCIGGVEVVAAETFRGFAYVALGHLHRPQRVGDPVADGGTAHYAGSLLKYSLNEVDQTKSFSVVDIDATGAATVRRDPVIPRRELRRLGGTLADLLAHAPQGSPDDYLIVALTDRGPVHDAMARLREHYPHVLHLDLPELEMPSSLRLPGRDHARLGVIDLFESFFAQVTGAPLSEAESAALVEVVAALQSAGEPA